MSFKKVSLKIASRTIVLMAIWLQSVAFAGNKGQCVESYTSFVVPTSVKQKKPQEKRESLSQILTPSQSSEVTRLLIFFSKEAKSFDSNMIDQVLWITKDYQQDVKQLNASLKEYEKYPFFIRLQDGSKQTLDLYRNPHFLDEVEYKVSSQSFRGSTYVNLVYGYQKSENDSKEKLLGQIAAIDLDQNGHLKSMTFRSEKQMKHFKKHFLGSPFTAEKKKKILEVNTEIFQELGKIPSAAEQVAAFEKSRGWPVGTAAKLGLVYYSKDMFDVRKWARKKWEQEHVAISFNDLYDAGWLKMEFGPNGEVLFKENYDDSIKIPLFDKQDPTKITSWRTRNLKKNSHLPKYLSWPKDKSLYAGEELPEEVYNLWNLNQARGQRIVITEGEFKCAIGQMKTGIFHLGLPGISQFSSALREELVTVQPKEVIILFDKDPKGKALFRVDMVTDSERAAYSIAKELESVGLNAKVAYLPDVNQGGKLGLDDLILDKGVSPYLQALNQAVAPQKFAEQKNLDVPLTELTFRNNKLKKVIKNFRRAMDSTKGAVNIEDYKTLQKLENQSEILNSALRQYTQQVYSMTTGLQNVNPKIKVFKDKQGVVSKVRVSEQEFAIQEQMLILEKEKISPQSNGEDFLQALQYIFPADDYVFMEKAVFKKQQYAWLILRKEDLKPIALVSDKNAVSKSLQNTF